MCGAMVNIITASPSKLVLLVIVYREFSTHCAAQIAFLKRTGFLRYGYTKHTPRINNIKRKV